MPRVVAKGSRNYFHVHPNAIVGDRENQPAIAISAKRAPTAVNAVQLRLFILQPVILNISKHKNL